MTLTKIIRCLAFQGAQLGFLLGAGACMPRVSDSLVNVVGGQTATPHAYPFMVSIFSERKQQTICGGSLIAPKVVLTAAHCFESSWFPGWQHKVRIGKHDMSKQEEGEESLTIAKVKIHPAFGMSERGLRNDVALVFLKESSRFKPIRFNRATQEPPPNSLQRVIGWGLIHEEAFFLPQYQLLQVDLPIVDNSTCAKLNRQFDIEDHQLCAGYIDGRTRKDACQGDSGGPIFAPTSDPVLFGVVSSGDGCAHLDKPGVYTRVSAYVDWIESQVGTLPE